MTYCDRCTQKSSNCSLTAVGKHQILCWQAYNSRTDLSSMLRLSAMTGSLRMRVLDCRYTIHNEVVLHDTCARTRTCIHSENTKPHTRTHTHVHTYMHTHSLTHAHTPSVTHTRTHTHTHAHTLVHACTHAHAHPHAHTYTLAPSTFHLSSCLYIREVQIHKTECTSHR